MSLSEYDAVGATSFPAFARLALIPSRVKGSGACSPMIVSFSAKPTLPTFVGSWRRQLVEKDCAAPMLPPERMRCRGWFISDSVASVLRGLNLAIASKPRNKLVLDEPFSNLYILLKKYKLI